MVTLCQKCGCIGYPEHLIYCLVCKISAEHRYCLDQTQIEEETEDFVKWTCYECFQKASKIDPGLSLDKTKDKIRCQDVRDSRAAAVSLKRRCKDSKHWSLKKAEKLFSRQPGEDINNARECSLTKIEEKQGATALKKRCTYMNDSRLSLDKTKDKIRYQNVRESHAAAVSLKRRCKDGKGCSLKKAEKLLSPRQPPSEDIMKSKECSLTKAEENRGASAVEKRCTYINGCSLGKADKSLISRHSQNESSNKEGNGSLQNIGKEKGLVSFTAEKWKQKRRLMLTDDGSCDEESTSGKTGWGHKGEEATNRNAIAVRKPVGSSSSGADSGYAVERAHLIFGASESSIKEGHDSLQNIGKEMGLISFTAEKQKRKRRPILSDDDSCDEESTYVNTGWDCKGEEATNGNATAMRMPVGSSSLGADSGCAVERLKSISGASELMFRASDFRNPGLTISYDRLASNCHNYVPAQPIIHPIWRGCFNICNSTYDMIAAHLSSKACSRVSEGANMLPPVLFAEKLQRTSAWPKAFKSSPPTADHIGLYFLPEQFCDGGFLDQLLCEINDRDLVLKVMVNELELLIFSSQLLPLQDSTFQGKCYLWGVFRRRQMHLLNTDEAASDPTDKVSASPSNGEDQQKNLPMKRWSSSPQTSHGNDRQSMEKQFDCSNVSDEMMEAPAITVDDDESEKDATELELFPLAVEDMAITARIGRMNCFDLDLGLGLGRSTSDGGAIRLETKADGLALDKAIL